MNTKYNNLELTPTYSVGLLERDCVSSGTKINANFHPLPDGVGIPLIIRVFIFK